MVHIGERYVTALLDAERCQTFDIVISASFKKPESTYMLIVKKNKKKKNTIYSIFKYFSQGSTQVRPALLG